MAKQVVAVGNTGEELETKLANNFDELYARQSYIGQLNVKGDDFGAKGDGITDDSAAVLAALQAAVTGATGIPVYVPAGNYLIDNDIVLHNITRDLNIISDGNVTFNCGTHIFSFLADNLLGTTTLTASCAKWEVSVSVANPLTFSVGDIIHITSSDTWAGTSYPKGELQKIRKIVGNTIYFYEYLFDDYDMATTVISQYAYPRFTAKNIKFIFDAQVTGINITRFKHVLIDGLEIVGARTSGLTTWYCYDVLVARLESYKTYESIYDSGYAYGYTIASCQNVIMRDSFISGAKHGVMIGGSHPNRNIKILSSYFSEQINGHGNCELVDIIGNTCYGPLTFWGKSCRIVGNLMYGLGVRPEFGRGSYAIALAPACASGGVFVIEGNRIVNGNFMTCVAGGIGIDLLDIKNNVADHYGDIIIMRQPEDPQGLIKQINVANNTNIGFQHTEIKFEEINLHGNSFATTYFPILIESIPDADATGTISILGNKIKALDEIYPIRIGRYDESPDNPQAKHCFIKGNVIEFKSVASPVAVGKWCDLIVDEYLEVSGNTFINLENPAKISSAAQKCYWDNNILVDVINPVVNNAVVVITN